MSSFGASLAAAGIAAALTLAGGSFAFASASQSFTGSGYGPQACWLIAARTSTCAPSRTVPGYRVSTSVNSGLVLVADGQAVDHHFAVVAGLTRR